MCRQRELKLKDMMLELENIGRLLITKKEELLELQGEEEAPMLTLDDALEVPPEDTLLAAELEAELPAADDAATLEVPPPASGEACAHGPTDVTSVQDVMTIAG